MVMLILNNCGVEDSASIEYKSAGFSKAINSNAKLFATYKAKSFLPFVKEL